ncbi:MAG: DUF1983 domain-containing protein [Opitutaceae bacterium]
MPKTAGLDGSDMSTNEQGVPVLWWIGPGALPLTWVVSDVLNQRTEEVKTKAGKGGETVSGYKYYGDVAGIAGLGLLARITAIESNNEIVWTGSIVRPDNPLHPDYWRVKIVTPVADVYVYWGRADQPIDDILLGPTGTANSSLRHPAYRNQVLVILKNYFLGEGSGTVPNTRIFGDRAPRPQIGVFPAQLSTQGESIVAGELELMTNPIFGAGLPVTMFVASDWEDLSANVMNRIGRHAPYLDRSRPLRDAVKDFQLYYDGWCRISNGIFKPGYYPHDGTTPPGLTELSVHDYTERPKVKATSPSRTINDVVVVVRDAENLLKKVPVSESASDNVEARSGHEASQVEMLGIVDTAQGAVYASEAAATGAEGTFEGEIKVRRPRAVWANGQPLEAGDNFVLDLLAPEIDQVSRIVRRTDYYSGTPSFDIEAERGVFPMPYVRPADLRPQIGKVIPVAIAQARILELTPALAGSPIGLPISFLAKRPSSVYEDSALFGANVVGFYVWYSASGSSYDSLGVMPGWAVRGVLRSAIASGAGDLSVQVTLDADNLDRNGLASQGAEAQADDTLLAVVGDEIFSVGAISIDGLACDLASKRARLGTLATAHGQGDEVWLIYRENVRSFIHARFVEDQDRWFKLQPYTASATIELAEIDPIQYHFRDRADELPVIVLGALPSGARVGVSYQISGTISDVNSDLTSYQVNTARIVAGQVEAEITLQAGEFPPTAKSLFAFRCPVVFASAGTWRVIIRAYDERGFTELSSADFAIATGDGTFGGGEDTTIPNPASGFTVVSGVEGLLLRWTNSENTPLRYTYIYESATDERPSVPSFIVLAPQAFYFRNGLTSGQTRKYWLEEAGQNGKKSTIIGPVSGTVVLWPVVSDIDSRLIQETNTRVLAVSNEANLRAQADNGLQTSVSQEAYARQSADGAIISGLTTEVSARQSGDSTLSASVTQESQARVSDVNSLAAEYVLSVVTNAGGLRRVAGFRVTNKGGADGQTAFVIQADKIALVNSSGDNQRAPFAVTGGITYLDVAMIRDADITRAKLAQAIIGEAQIDTAAISTLKVAGNAITAPTFAEWATYSSLPNGVYTEVVAAYVSVETGQSAIISVSFALADDGASPCPDCDISIYRWAAAQNPSLVQIKFHDWTVRTGNTELISVSCADVNVPYHVDGYSVRLRPRNGGTNARPSARSPSVAVLHAKR